MATQTTPRPPIDARLARDLVDAQFPQYSELPLTLLDPAGSDHVLYRLGTDLLLRLPRHEGAIGQAPKEARWLPRLAPRLPLAVPEPVVVGRPDLGYPWPWAVTRWLDGETATVEALADSSEAAVALADFLSALHAATPPRELSAEEARELAYAPLAERDESTRRAITETGDVFGREAMARLWDDALAAPAWTGPPVLVHGDFHTGNLLAVDGRVTAVIDFGGLALGDPACDLTIAFTLMSAATRAVFRERLALDEATWTRGRGWALATGLNAYCSYAATRPRVAAQTTRQITQALAG